MQSVEEQVSLSDGQQKASLDALWAQLAAPISLQSFSQSWLELQCSKISHAVAGLVLNKSDQLTTFVPAAIWPKGQDVSYMGEIAQQVATDKTGAIKILDHATAESIGISIAGSLIACPIELAGEVQGIVVIALSVSDQGTLQTCLRDLFWGVGRLESFLFTSRTRKFQEQNTRLELVLNTISSMTGKMGFDNTAYALVTDLANSLGCDRVSLGAWRPTGNILKAISHKVDTIKTSLLTQYLTGAMDEACDQNRTILYPGEGDFSAVATLAHHELAQYASMSTICSVPLVLENQLIACLLLEWHEACRPRQADIENIEAVAALAAPVLSINIENDQSISRRILEKLHASMKLMLGPKHTISKFAGGTFIFLILLSALVSGQYRVTADAHVEGELIHATVAPFDAYIEESYVKPGDVVTKGQVLVELDDRDLLLEKAKWKASINELQQHSREAIANGERATAAITHAQLKQAEAELGLIEKRLARTRILSEYDGIVISGDLSQSLGAPVAKGSQLHEITPLSEYRVVLEVEESDYDEIMPGQTGILALRSLANDDFPFTVVKVTPVSTPADGRNVFRVEARLDSVSDRLRPGMEGVAKVDIDQRSLIWIWTHRTLDWLNIWVWSWMP